MALLRRAARLQAMSAVATPDCLHNKAGPWLSLSTTLPLPGGVAPRPGARQTRNEVALHGVSPIAWGCQNDAPSSKVL
jgi:hypothetical protein